MRKTNRERYEVEWCSKMGYDEAGDFNPDLCTYATQHFDHSGSAVIFAHELLAGHTQWVIAYPWCMIRQQSGQPHTAYSGVRWETVARCEFTSPTDTLEMERV